MLGSVCCLLALERDRIRWRSLHCSFLRSFVASFVPSFVASFLAVAVVLFGCWPVDAAVCCVVVNVVGVIVFSFSLPPQPLWWEEGCACSW